MERLSDYIFLIDPSGNDGVTATGVIIDGKPRDDFRATKIGNDKPYCDTFTLREEECISGEIVISEISGIQKAHNAPFSPIFQLDCSRHIPTGETKSHRHSGEVTETVEINPNCECDYNPCSRESVVWQLPDDNQSPNVTYCDGGKIVTVERDA